MIISDHEPIRQAINNGKGQPQQKPAAQKPAPQAAPPAKAVVQPPPRWAMPPPPEPKEFKAPDGHTYVFPSADAVAGFQRSLQGIDLTLSLIHI